MWWRHGGNRRSQARIRSSTAPRVEALEDRTLLAAGVLDASFGTGGRVLSDFAATNNPAHALAVQRIGGVDKVLVVGATTVSPGFSDVLLMRFNPNGTRDQTFGLNGVVVTDLGGNDEARALAVQSDGRIVIAGFSNGNFAVVRYEPNGLLDATFGAGGRVVTDFGGIDQARAVALQPDGKIVVAGVSNGNFALARYLPNGALDITFGLNGQVLTDFGGPEEARSVLVQSDGRIVVAGVSFGDFALVRYLGNGSRDVTFGLGGLVTTDFGGTDEANSVVALSDGRIVVAGTAGVNDGDFALARYFPSGALDPSFGVGGRVVSNFSGADRAAALLQQPGGKLVVAGTTGGTSADTGAFAVARYNANGTLDAGFGVSGLATTSFVPSGRSEGHAVALQSDGKILVAGEAQNSATTTGIDVAVARFQVKSHILVTGANAGASPHVRVRDAATGAVRLSFYAYAPTFNGGVRVATGDFNGDGIDDIVTGPGQGGGPSVRVFSGSDGSLLREFLAYSANFLGGVNVAVGDVNGDGVPDIITGAGPGGGPHVRVFSGTDNRLLHDFFAFEAVFRAGVNVAAGDINGDGRADLITAAGASTPRVIVFSGATRAVLRNFLAYSTTFLGGVNVSAADVNGDGVPDIITGAAAGGGPHVAVFSGTNNALLRSFYAFDAGFRGGVSVTAVDVNGDGLIEIVTGAHSASPARVRSFHSVSLALVSDFTAYDTTFQGGVFVAGA